MTPSGGDVPVDDELEEGEADSQEERMVDYPEGRKLTSKRLRKAIL